MNPLCLTIIVAVWIGQPQPNDPLGTKKQAERVDRQGDPLPPAALLRLGSMRFRGDAYAVSRAVAASPDRKTLASTEIGSVVRLWDAATGHLLRELRGHTGVVVDIAFSPDGKVLATAGSDKTVRLWNTDSGEERLRLETPPLAITSVAFSPDGAEIAGGCHDATIRLWDARTGKEKRKINGHRAGVTSITFAPDGKTLASGSLDNTVGLWETATSNAVRRFEGHQSEVHAVAFSPDGKKLFSGSRQMQSLGISSFANRAAPKPFLDKDGSMRIWDVATGQARHFLAGPKHGVHSLTCRRTAKRWPRPPLTIRFTFTMWPQAKNFGKPAAKYRGSAAPSLRPMARL